MLYKMKSIDGTWFRGDVRLVWVDSEGGLRFGLDVITVIEK